MNYTDWQTHIRRMLEESSPGTWADTSIMHFTNEAVRQVARKARPMRDEEYTTAVVGQTSYDLPLHTLNVISVVFHDTDGTKYTLAREDVTDTVTRTDGSYGTPVAYAVDDESLYLRPAPATAGTIRFWRYRLPTPITSTASESLVEFADTYPLPLEYHVLMRAFEQVGDWDSADRYRDRFREAITDVISEEAMQDSAGMPSAPVETF